MKYPAMKDIIEKLQGIIDDEKEELRDCKRQGISSSSYGAGVNRGAIDACESVLRFINREDE